MLGLKLIHVGRMGLSKYTHILGGKGLLAHMEGL